MAKRAGRKRKPKVPKLTYPKNQKQIDLFKYISEGMNVEEAAIKAGFAPAYARNIKYKPYVMEYIAQRAVKLEDSNWLTAGWLINRLKGLIDGAEAAGEYSAAISGVKLLGSAINTFKTNNALNRLEEQKQLQSAEDTVIEISLVDGETGEETILNEVVKEPESIQQLIIDAEVIDET